MDSEDVKNSRKRNLQIIFEHAVIFKVPIRKYFGVYSYTTDLSTYLITENCDIPTV